MGPPVRQPPLTGVETEADSEALFGYRFASPALLREALTHRSAAGKGGRGSNERLEFLGDRVLGLLIAEWLAERYPNEQEGALGVRLSHLVSRTVLSEIADAIGLGPAIAMPAGEARAGVARRATVLADTLEAALGAIYLDGGLDPARRFVRTAWAARIEAAGAPPKDPKTELQEYTLGRGWGLPAYALLGSDGPAHAPCFRVGVTVPGASAAAAEARLAGSGSGVSKRAAERAAAIDLLARLAAARSPA